jgi:pimeloyl-ACP methyl ester carboxylesterase
MNRREMLLSTGALLTAGWVPEVAVANAVLGSGGDSRLPAGASRASPEPFHVAFGPDRIGQLHRRIDATRWPTVPFETGWSAGTDDRVLRDLVRYWRHDYDWKRVQSDLNRLPHYRLPVEGERLHFVWYRGTGPRQPFPLLLLHGWPSSFLEYAKVAEPLMRGGAGQPGFDLVVPSLPGYVFSAAPRRPGMHPGEVAGRMHALMQTLGYRRYGVAAGDWGAVVALDLAKAHAEAVTGLAWPGTPWVRPPKERALTDEERAFLDASDRFDAEELAYFRLQSTKPQTLSYALQDSPVGLLAWVLEKFWAWSDLGPDLGRGGRNGPGDLWATLDRADVLTPTTLYWLTGTVLSASRLYYENEHRPPASQIAGPVAVPTLAMGFPKDPFTSAPKSLLDTNSFARVVRVEEKPRGGHFAALEQPKLWADDVFTFFTGLSK